METLRNTAEMLESALDLHQKGLRLVPLRCKAPLARNWPELHLGEREIRQWCRLGVNWAAITGAPLVVVDSDSATAEARIAELGITSTVEVFTGGGRHRYFLAPAGAQVRCKNGIHGVPGFDIKGWHGLAVLPGSIHPDTGRPYAFLPGKELRSLAELPVFDPRWIAEASVPLPTRPTRDDCVSTAIRNIRAIRDVRAYIHRIPSIEGQGGDKACFTVACLLVEAGCTLHEALMEIEVWNERCAIPCWSRAALERKIRSAFERVRCIGKDEGR